MNTIQKMIATAAMMMVAAGISNAATISFNALQGPTLTDFNISLTLPKFDGDLGTLTGATIRFTATDDISALTLTNTSGASQTFRYRSIADFLLSGNTADSTLTGTDLPVTNFDSGFITLGPTGSGACPAGTPSAACNSVSYVPAPATANTGDVAVSVLGAYIGSLGNTTFTLTGFTSTSTTFNGGGGNINSVQVTNGTAAAVVTYTYDAAPPSDVPEPATMALMGSSLLGLALFSRRFQK
jgi:hypothetical protein